MNVCCYETFFSERLLQSVVWRRGAGVGATLAATVSAGRGPWRGWGAEVGLPGLEQPGARVGLPGATWGWDCRGLSGPKVGLSGADWGCRGLKWGFLGLGLSGPSWGWGCLGLGRGWRWLLATHSTKNTS